MDEVTRQGENQQNPMTEYVVTRWYRCPELLLSPNRPYDEAIDLWSIGCILAELLRRKPLFPGKSHANQVQLIFEVMGFNSVKEMGFPVSAEAASFLEKRCRGRKQPWSKLFPDATIQAVELLESLLMLNPTDRPTAQEALQYSFFGDAETLYDYSLDYLKPPPANFFDFEMAKFTVPVLKEMIDNEVLLSSATNYRKPSIPTITVPHYHCSLFEGERPRPAAAVASSF
jgi:mitogen-activated protein kinase 1/3